MKPAGFTNSPSKAGLIIITTLLTGAATLAFADGDGTETASSPAADKPAPYTVVCEETKGKTACKVDKQTYIGWRTYHAVCHVCHAQDAVGSTFAPNLVERLSVIDEARFMDVIANGYTGQIGVMPAWKDNPNVNRKYNELYGYLKARSDGALQPGRPKRLHSIDTKAP
jgi:mono/diheme cytochrome c family protein